MNSSSRTRGHNRSRGGNTHSARNSRPNRASSSRANRGQKKITIDPSRFVSKGIDRKDEVAYVPEHTFADFAFATPLYKNIVARGYEHPTPVQDEAIPFALAGRDLIGLANTGTGKTAAFVLPIINRFVSSKSKEQALVLAPTRELALQIQEEFNAFAKGFGLESVLCVGGVGIEPQKRALRRNPAMIIATPGRLLDLVKQKCVRLESTSVFVLDEFDRMLDMGFIRDIQFIVERLPKNRQTLCLSATITPEIKKHLDAMLVNPASVSVRTRETSEHVRQDVIHAKDKKHKMELLQALLEKMKGDKIIIFGRTKYGVQKLAQALSRSGFPSVDIHGNRSQPQRQRALKDFKNGRVSIMVATDVAARGLDIPNVGHVINYDEPNTYDDYVHRIGRTGRAGKSGRAFTFVGD